MTKPAQKPRYKWQPLIKATTFKPPAPDLLAETMRRYSVDEAGARALLEKMRGEIWVNDLYQVEIHADPVNAAAFLNIRRRDGGPILRDWRHFQWIKNQLVGKECEAVELYPAESRLVDEANKYHLFASTDPTFRFPFGFQERNVDCSERAGSPGMRQRPL